MKFYKIVGNFKKEVKMFFEVNFQLKHKNNTPKTNSKNEQLIVQIIVTSHSNNKSKQLQLLPIIPTI